MRDTNWNNLLYGGWLDGDFVPSEVSVAWGSPGQSSYFPDRYTFMVVLAGSVMHQIKTGRRLQVRVQSTRRHLYRSARHHVAA